MASELADFDGDGHLEALYKGVKYVDKNGDVGHTSVSGGFASGVGDIDNDGPTSLSGTVELQDGTPVKNATVRVYGVDYDNLSATDPDVLDSEANDLIDNATNIDPPDSWDSNLDMESDVITDAEAAERQWVSLHDENVWADRTPDLTSPLYKVPANKPFSAVVWDSSEVGEVLQDSAERDHIGEIVGDTPVVFEQVSPTGEPLSTSQVGTDWEWDPYAPGQDTNEYATMVLDPGFYRVYPKGQQASSYTIVAGDPGQITSAFAQDLNDTADQLTDRAKWIRNLRDQRKFYRANASTNATGHWSTNVPGGVGKVGAFAYKGDPGAFDKDIKNITQRDLRDAFENGTLDGSVYMPSDIRRLEPPKSGVTLRMREAGSPTFSDLNTSLDNWENLRDRLLNGSEEFQDLLQQHNATREELENVYQELYNLTEQNDRLRERVNEIDNTTSGDKFLVGINIDDATDGELRSSIQAMQSSIDQLRSTIPTETVSSTGPETVSSTAIFDDADLSQDDVTVLAHLSNGTTATVPDEYISVSQSTGTVIGQGATEVSVSSYPLGDAGAVEFEWIAATENQHATASETVENPTVSASPPDVESVRLSSLVAGPDERVSVELNPAADADFQNLTSVTVYAPNGSTLSTSAIRDGDTFDFSTVGTGRYTLQLTYEDTGGSSWTKTVHMRAGEEDENRDPSLKPASGPTGLYVLATDGLAGGDVAKDGTTLGLTAKIDDRNNPPTTIHGYLQDIDRQPSGDIEFDMQDESGQRVDSRTELIIHAKAMPADGTYVYRNGEPVTVEGTYVGSRTHMPNQTRISTYTDEDGTVTLDVRQPQGIVDSTIEGARWQVRLLQLRISSAQAAYGGGISLGALAALIPVSIVIRRRRERDAA